MNADPLYVQYAAALRQHGTHPVVINSTLLDMTVIVSAVQLALRHPLFPKQSKDVVARFVQGFIEQIRTRDLVIAEVLERGNDPHHDVPTRRRDRR